MAEQWKDSVQNRTKVVMIVRKKQDRWVLPTWTGTAEIANGPAHPNHKNFLVSTRRSEQTGGEDRPDRAHFTLVEEHLTEQNPLEEESATERLSQLCYPRSYRSPTASPSGTSRPRARLQDLQSEGLGSPRTLATQSSVVVVEGNPDSLLSGVIPQDLASANDSTTDAGLQRMQEVKLRSSPPMQTRKLNWKRNREAIMLKCKNTRLCVAILGSCGMLCAIGQNELIFRSWDPRSPFVDILKAANSFLSLASVAFLIRSYYLNNLFKNLKDLIYSVGAAPKPFCPWNPVKLWKLWLEIGFCGAHIPPFLTFEVPSRTLKNFTLYRAETVGALGNVLRIYLLWPCVRDAVLAKYPKHHTVGAFYDMSVGSAFALKALVNGSYAVPFIAVVWIITMFVLGYWFRGVENTACLFWNETIHKDCYDRAARVHSLTFSEFEKVNDLYLQNALWAMFVTSTTVGYGDIVPTTHLGRGIASAMAILGISLIALLTASLANALQFTAAELSAILVMEREKARQTLTIHAANRIRYWWRVHKGRPHGWWHTPPGWQWRTELRQHQRQSQIEVEDCLADDAKVDKIAEAFKYVAAAMELIAHKVASSSSSASRPPSSHVVRAAAVHSDALPLLLQNVKARKASLVMQKRLGEQTAIQDEASSACSKKKKKKTKQKKALPAEDKTNAWKRDKDAVQRAIVSSALLAALFGLLGAASAIAQNELVVRGNHPSLREIQVLKGAGSVLTLLCILCIVRLYWRSLLFDRLMRHISRGTSLDTDVPLRAVLSQPLFWLEMLVVVPHVPPFVTFELGTTTLQNFSLYRAETVASSWNLARVYLFWRVVREWAVSDLPKRHTVASFASVQIGSVFAMKRMLNSWYALAYLATAWLVLVMLLGYLFRSAELTACESEAAAHWMCKTSSASTWTINVVQFEKRNDLYIQNAVWLVFVTTMTVGYGDVVPTTHYGRLAVSLAALLGIVMASLVTASCANMIQWHPNEAAARAMLMREQARQQLAARAVDLLSFWWRSKNGRRLSRRQQHTDSAQLRRAFREVQETAVVDVEECASSSSKLEQIVRRARELQSKVDGIADRLWADDGCHHW